MKEIQITVVEADESKGEIRWECDDSSTGYCLYDETIDPMCDWCLYCGEPYERK